LADRRASDSPVMSHRPQPSLRPWDLDFRIQSVYFVLGCTGVVPCTRASFPSITSCPDTEIRLTPTICSLYVTSVGNRPSFFSLSRPGVAVRGDVQLIPFNRAQLLGIPFPRARDGRV
jgi:hypothetical protein